MFGLQHAVMSSVEDLQKQQSPALIDRPCRTVPVWPLPASQDSSEPQAFDHSAHAAVPAGLQQLD